MIGNERERKHDELCMGCFYIRNDMLKLRFELVSGLHSQLVDEVIEGWDAFTKTLSGSDSSDKLVGLGAFLEGISVELLPMIEHALREGTTGGGGTESLGETE